MTVKTYSPDTAIQLAWSPLKYAPTEQGDKSVTTSSGTLFADCADTKGFGARRCRVYNTDGSATLGIFFIRAGATATGLTIANSVKVAPGVTYEFVVSNNMRVAAVSSSGTITVNVLVHDLA
jgi:hypothetical protein